MSYDVVLLVEQALTQADARQVRSLHEAIEEDVVYHVLLPLDDASARIEAAMGTLGAGEIAAAPSVGMHDVDLEKVRRECEADSAADLAETLAELHRAGATAHGAVITEPPVDALVAKVKEVDGREAIVLTQPHVVAEFFHVDWTSRARRHLGVPVLHLLEHESFGEQAGGAGEGVTGL